MPRAKGDYASIMAHDYFKTFYLKTTENLFYKNRLSAVPTKTYENVKDIPIPRRLKQRSRKNNRNAAYEYRCLLQEYVSPLWKYRLISKDIGYGLFASRKIRAGTTLPRFGRRVTLKKRRYQEIETKKQDFSFVEVDNRFYRLTGPVAFVNHACRACANLVPEVGTTDYVDMKVVQDIPEDQQLVFYYGNNMDFPCCQCGARSVSTQ